MNRKNLECKEMIRDNDTTVVIFHYASYLKHQGNRSILPAALIKETLQSLALLLSQHDNDTKKQLSELANEVQKEDRLPLDLLARKYGQLKAEERQIDQFN
ncbi:hypothetical protein WAI453_002588 [Rhynchosporium graminicola]